MHASSKIKSTNNLILIKFLNVGNYVKNIKTSLNQFNQSQNEFEFGISKNTFTQKKNQ